MASDSHDARATMERYDYSAMSPETVRQAADEGLAEAERLIAQVVHLTGSRTFENTLAPLSDAAAAVWTADGRGAAIGLVHPDARVRDAAGGTRDRTEKWRNGLPRRDDVAAAVRAYAATDEGAGLTGARRRVLDLWLRDLRRAGHELEPTSRAELARLQDRIVELGVTFDRNLANWTDQIELDQAGVAGLPSTFVEQLPDGATPGTKRLPIQDSSAVSFLEQSARRDLRQLVLERLLSRAADENRPIVEELVALRHQLARLMGAESWSQFANEARMSGGAAAVRDFLGRVLGPLQELAVGERAVMQSLLEAEGAGGDVQAWDWLYCHERQRRALGLDSSELSAHLPLDTVLNGLFDVVRDVFGVLVAEDAAVNAWHPDVRFYVLRDAATDEHLAELYLDPFAREGKYPHPGWMFPLDPGSNARGSDRRPPVLQLAMNIAPPVGSAASLLHHEVAVLLFHEFGHVLEFGLQRAEVFNAQSSWAELDFIEAPSQIMEHWAWAPEVLRRFARHHATGAPPSDELLERLAASRRLNSATSNLWWLGYRAVLDQALHGSEPVDSGQAYRDAFALTGFPFPEGTYRPASFTHLVGYPAGFYSYLWAQVFGDDMFSAFRTGGLLSSEVGRRYRTTLLEPTWTVPGRERVRNFLGREPSDAAFLERLGIAVTPFEEV
jgi:Zn-dependent oligopeptidase